MVTEVNTFSAAVDDVVSRAARPDRKADVYSYVRSTLREMGAKAYFKRDLVEDTLTADQDNYIWTYPQEFRIMRTVRYPFVNMRDESIYPPEILPGKKQREHTNFYYGGNGYYVFAGTENGDSIDVAYYTYPKKLPYYAEANRPARFDVETNAWIYLTSGTPTEEQTWRDQCSNWILFNYYDTVVEGALAKLFKTVGDPRASATYALYKSLQMTFVDTEPSDSLNK